MMVTLDPVMQAFLAGSQPARPHIVATYMFGSRARGTARPDSDYDLMLVVSEQFSQRDKDQLYDAVMDVLLETGRLVSLKIFSHAEFQRLRQLRTPFMTHVLDEGINVG